jgi:WD40 repeat protein
VTFASDAETAIISAHDSRVTNWKLNPLSPGVTYWQKVLVGHVALSADGKILATGGNDNLLKVWRAESGQELRLLRGHTAAISHLALSADGKTLISADINNEIKVWATDPAEDANVLTHDGIVVHTAISPDDEMLATSDPNFFTVRLWNLRTRAATPFISKDKAQVAFSPDGKWLAIGRFNGPVELWDRMSMPYRKAQVVMGLSAIGYHLNFSPDSRILAFRAAGDVVELWDVAAQKSLGQLQNHSSVACGTAFSSDGKLIATGSDSQVRIFQVRSQRLLATIGAQDSSIRSVCFSPDASVLAAASGNAQVRRWNISDPTRPRPLPPLTGHTAFVPQIAFSPDGKTLATASYDSTLRLWNAALGQEVAVLRGHSAVVQCLTWSADGQAIFTGSGDATVRIWRAPSWEEIAAAEDKARAQAKQP